ncbi:MAG: rod shape-determining protein MreD [Nitrospinaceae bacterium]|jgi:rod shape-determining protein MreD|nr:rod shape-determining protein MreD [Nitrospinaceae bacterium]MBT3434838.1 rod shape-determining protein MreD [Nitrospinaceae bacterium]MBT3823202.1 rod shape-determining protein MreD [Nitrospinaceae bacterium]MBT4092894.1 rod shape-determining protein MreD [Nitrospinaceae bacterium]MBT4429881.1 rod shape-determining protein MreD [Nitrospinaceae bacterium]
MTIIFFLFAGVGAIVFQTTLSEYFFVWTSARPDAMLLVTLYIAMRRGNEGGLLTGFAMGLLQDILAGGLLGANSLSKGLLGYSTGGLVRDIAGRNWFFMMTLGFFTTAFDVVLWALLSLMFQPDIGISADYWYASLKTIFLNAILAPVFIHLLSGIEDKIIPQSIGVPYPNRS